MNALVAGQLYLVSPAHFLVVQGPHWVYVSTLETSAQLILLHGIHSTEQHQRMDAFTSVTVLSCASEQMCDKICARTPGHICSLRAARPSCRPAWNIVEQ